MSWIKHLSFIALFFAVVTASANPQYSVSNSCSQLFAQSETYRYAHNVTNRRDFIQFGFESEFHINDSGIQAILKDYAPLGLIKKDLWLSMSESERLNWTKKNLMSEKPTYSVTSGLKRIVRDEQLDFLPDELILDATGNLEIVLKPVDTFEALSKQIAKVEARYGRGSKQSMVSSPREALFANGTRAVRGFLNLVHDIDVIQKLDAGAKRWNPNNPSPVARSFLHPFLGPSTALKQGLMWKYLEANAKGEMFDSESLKFIKSMDDSFKYVGSTAYRPDIASPYRVSFEVRDAHQNTELLEKRTWRLIDFLTNASSARKVSRYADVRALDQVGDFAKLPPEVQSMLRDVIGSYRGDDPTYVYSGSELLAVELFRNFSFPMRDWSDALVALGRGDALNQVTVAQGNFVKRLKEISEKYSTSTLSKEATSIQVQGALVMFAQESGLNEVYQTAESRTFRSMK